MNEIVEAWARVGDGCFVSSLGRVRGKQGRILKPVRRSNGYVLVSVAGLGKQYIHRLVCEAFHGPAPHPLYQVDHRNSVRDDNNAANLRWVTKAENLAHRKPSKGEAHARAKLTEHDVRAIRSEALSHLNNVQLAPKFNVTRETVRDARNRKLWRHVQ
jgi:hypothetical protein